MSAAAIAVWGIPLLGGLLARVLSGPSAARRAALLAMTVTLALAIALVVSSPATLPRAVVFGADEMSSVLLVTFSALVLAVLIGAPRAGLDARGTSDLLLVSGATLAALSSNHVAPFALGWGLSLAPLALEARRERRRAVLRAAVLLGLLAVAPMIAALAAAGVGARLGAPGAGLDFASLAASPFVRRWQSVLAPMAIVAVVTRAGIFPFHVWVPAVMERARLPLALPVVISPLGSFAAVRVLLVLFPEVVREVGPWLVVWGAASACHGALLAFGRNNVRRQLGYLWVSAASCILAGIGTLHDLALAGALFYDVTVAAALTGLCLIAGAVEARTGTADMRRLGGLVRSAPMLATAYLLLGLAVISFPGTAGFVSEHLFVQGLHEVNPTIAIVLLGATAVNGITLVRSYKRVFLGPGPDGEQAISRVDDALPRERLVLATLIVLLVVGWFLPTPLLRVRESVAAVLRP